MPHDRPSDPTATPSPRAAGPAQAGGPAQATGPAQAGAVATAVPPLAVPTQFAPPVHGPWPAPTAWGRRWPGPARPAPAPVLAGVAVIAVTGAAAVPLGDVGVGWLLTMVAGVIALAVARRVGTAAPPGPAPLVHRRGPLSSPVRYGWTAITVALIGVGAVRSAGWLFLLCLCAAAVTGALAVAGGRSTAAMVAAVGTAPAAGLRAMPWLTAGFHALRRTRAGAAPGTRVAATAGVCVALLVVFGALFASADAAFARFLSHAVPDLGTGTVVRWIVVGACAGGVLAGAAYLRAAPPDLSAFEAPDTRRVRRLEWAAPIATLVLLFAAFVSVQLTVLFGGGEHVLRTAGLTYAEYARHGFWQLLAVTGLTLLVLAGAARWAPRVSRTDRRLIRLLLGALSGLTLVIVGSALHRMDVYADTYGLTRLRLLVGLCEAWLGLVFVLILAAGVRLRATWLPRAMVATAALALLGLAAANPDALIAERNVTTFAAEHRLDLWYLSGLSPDAVPALDRLPAGQRECALAALVERLRRSGHGWQSWNAGRERARRHLTAHPVGQCP